MDAIWFCFGIPILAVAIGAIFFTKKFAIPEYLILFGVSSLLIVAAYYITVNSMTDATEYWSTYGVKVEHSERWNEYIHKTCSRENCSGTGKNRSCTTSYYDCSYVDNHPEYWNMDDNTNHDYSLSSSKYHEIVSKWKTESFTRTHSGCYTICGNVYNASYPADPTMENMIPITHEHTYENRVKASTSVFSFKKVDSLERANYGLYNHPRVGDKFTYTPILGDNDVWAQHKLRSLNALYGSQNQVHMMVLVFEDKPYEAGLYQEALWTGGNKNEFILCVGKSGDQIKWTKVISWTEEVGLKLRVEREVKAMDKFNIVGIVDYLGNNVPREWKRKHFKDFNYLHVDVPMSATIWTFVIDLLVTAGLLVFFIMNNWTLEGFSSRSSNSNYPWNQRRRF